MVGAVAGVHTATGDWASEGDAISTVTVAVNSCKCNTYNKLLLLYSCSCITIIMYGLFQFILFLMFH